MIFFYETKTITFVPQKMIMTENLTKNTFLEKVFYYEKNKDWVYEGKLPAIIDFYADFSLHRCPRLNYRLAKASSDLTSVETTFVRCYLYGRGGIRKLSV